MEKFIILPDVTCDLSPEMRAQFGLVDYVRGWVHINDKPLQTRILQNLGGQEKRRQLSCCQP